MFPSLPFDGAFRVTRWLGRSDRSGGRTQTRDYLGIFDNAYLTNESTSALALFLHIHRISSPRARSPDVDIDVDVVASPSTSSDEGGDGDVDDGGGGGGSNIAIDAHRSPPDAIPNSYDALPPGNISVGTFIAMAYA
jgi:hypothetical protein